MRKLILLFLVIQIISCNNNEKTAQLKNTDYNIKGKITGFTDSTKVYLKDINLDKDIDSTFIIKDTFSFSGKFKNDFVPEQLWLYINLNNGKDFYYTNLLIRNGDNVLIKGDKKNFPFSLNINGSKTQDEAKILDEKTRNLNIEYDKLVKEYFKIDEKDEKKKKEIGDKLKNINKQIDSITKEYVKKHFNSFNAIITLGYDKELLPKDTIKKMFVKTGTIIKNSKYGKKIGFYINNHIIKEGKQIYDFTAITQKGDTVKVSDYLNNNRYLLLDFNATYCGPCIQSVDELKDIYKKYSDKINIVGFNVDINKNIWEKGLKRDKKPWISLWDGKGNTSNTYLKYGISGVPTFFIINPEGKIIKKQIGYSKGNLIELLKNEKIIE